MSAVNGYTKVCVWLGRDENGCVTNSFEGFNAKGQKVGRNGQARCGHISMDIVESNSSRTYVSCWPTNGNNSNATLDQTFNDDINGEGGRPDAIIHLSKLDIPKMLRTFNEMKARVDSEEIRWVFNVADNKDITEKCNKTANCATFVYTILKSGGLGIKGHVYNSVWLRSRGPYNPFYNQTRCNLGDILRGSFNGAPWMSKYFTPKSLLLHAAAAAAAEPDDKNKTEKIMRSDQVSKNPKEVERAFGERVVQGAVVTGTIAAAAIYMSKRS